MLTEAEYAMDRRKLGCVMHEHDGVWWEATAPFHTKPAFEFRAFLPGTAKPQWHRSFLGYSHQVPERRYANRILEFMAMEEKVLREFSMKALRSEKRNQVRKGLKLCEIREITDVETCLEDIRQINISQARRLMDDDTFGLPDTYYTEHAEAWKAEMRMRVAMRGQEWWGAYHEGRLVAYMITCQVETVRFIQVMKTHTDYLKLCATDAIYFTALEQARESADCERIINGGPAREGLNHFKEQFLFKRYEAFYYTPGAWLLRLAKRLMCGQQLLRAHALRRFAAGSANP